MKEWTATITEDDLHFVEQAKRHYQVFAEALEHHGDDRTAGIFRKQEFYAERFLVRMGEPTEDNRDE